MQYTEGKLGRIFVLRLHNGDHLPDILESFAVEKSLPSALCFFLGGVRDKGRVVVGPLDGNVFPPNAVVRFLSGVHEVCGMGTIFLDEVGKPKLHMHASFGRGGSTITGCVRMGIDVWQIGEIIVLELIDIAALRAKDTKTDFEFLEIKSTTKEVN